MFTLRSLLPNFPHGPLAWINHEDLASRVNLAKQVGQSSEKRGLLTYQNGAEEDGPRCDAKFSLASNRHPAILKKVPKKRYGTAYIAFRYYLLVAL